MKPEMRPRPGGYEFVWEDNAVAIRLERLREKSDTISAEISAYEMPIAEDNPLLMGVRVNLMSDAAPARLAKRLSARKNNVHWPDLVEAAFASTIREYRKSSPAIHIGQLPARATPKWRLEPLLLDRHITLLHGHGDVGKSCLAALIGISVQHGWEGLGLKPLQGNVLVLDYEGNEDDWNETLKMVEAGMGLEEPPDLLYRRCHPPLVGDMEEIETIVKREDIKLAIVDSAIRACGGEKEAKDNASPMIDALAGLGVSVFLISHVSKEALGTQSERLPFASVFFWNGPRMVWEMRKEQDIGENRIDVALFNRKSNRSVRYPPFGYRITFDDTLGITVERRDIEQMVEISGSLPLKHRIYQLLQHGPLTSQAIAEELGEDSNSVKMTLSRGKTAGKWTFQAGSKPPLWGLREPES